MSNRTWMFLLLGVPSFIGTMAMSTAHGALRGPGGVYIGQRSRDLRARLTFTAFRANDSAALGLATFDGNGTIHPKLAWTNLSPT